MTNIFFNFDEITPDLKELAPNETPPVLYLDTVHDTVTVTCVAWANIRTDQTVYLYLNGTFIESRNVESRDPSGPNPAEGTPPVFPVPVAGNFYAGEHYTIKMQYKNIAGNDFYSKNLEFDVKSDSLAGEIKIDITEGAAGYSEDYPYLMPANIAVVQGKPRMKLTARSRGRVRFQDVGGGDFCNFYFDEQGLSPLVLIKIDKLHVDAAGANAPADEIYITRRDQTDEIISEPVVFGEYIPQTDPNVAQAIDRVSCNTKGISDGTTMCIISIIFNKDYIDRTSDDKIYIQVDDDVTIDLNTYNKNFPDKSVYFNKPNAPIVNYTAEFGIKTLVSGTHVVKFFLSKNSDACWVGNIDFHNLNEG